MKDEQELQRLTKLIVEQVKKELQKTGFPAPETTAITEPAAAPTPTKGLIIAIFTGGTESLQEALTELRKLLQAGYILKAVLTSAAKSLIGANRIQHAVGNIEIIDPGKVSTLELAGACDGIVIATLTVNTTSKLAAGILDSFVPNLVYHAIGLGKPVVAARNCSDPQTSACACIAGPATPPQIKNMLSEHLKTLESFGIVLCDAAQLSEKLLQILSQPASKTIEKEKREVITQADILSVKDKKELKVSKGAIITPLAKDIAEQLGIKIILE